MAEIKIEKKKPIWPWILIGLIILAVILYFLFRDKNNNQDVNEYVDSTSMGMDNQTENNGAVAAYINFVNGKADSMSLDHEYSNEALSKLIDATKAVSDKTGVDVRANLDEAKRLAEQITVNPTATTHADDIRKASTIIATALGTIQQSKFPDLSADSNNLMNEAKAIDDNDLTLNQKSTVKTFYDAAADLLQKMNNNY